MWLEFDKGRQEAHQRALQIIEQQEADAEAARISRLHDTYALEGQMLQDKYGAFEMARFQHAEIMAGLAEQQSQAEIAAAEKTAQMKQQAVSSSLNYVIMAGKLLLSTTAKDSKAVFAVTKAASLAQALVGTYAGAANALDDVPYPYNIAAAASVIAYGMAQVAAITSTGIGGGGGGVPVASPTTASAVDVSATQPMQAPTESKGEIHFHLEGNFVGSIPDEIVDDMIEKINEASESRNVHINVSNAKYAESVY